MALQARIGDTCRFDVAFNCNTLTRCVRLWLERMTFKMFFVQSSPPLQTLPVWNELHVSERLTLAWRWQPCCRCWSGKPWNKEDYRLEWWWDIGSWTTLPGQWSLITISQYNHSFHPMFPTDHCRLVSIFHWKVRWRSEHVYARITDTCCLT